MKWLSPLLRKGYALPKELQKLNYNRKKRDEIKSEKDISFLFVIENKASSSVNKVQQWRPLSVNATLVYLVHKECMFSW